MKIFFKTLNLLVLLALISYVPEAAAARPKTLNWAFVRGPLDLRVRDLTEKYSKVISEVSENELAFTLLEFPDEKLYSYGGGARRWSEALKALEDGRVDIAQVYAGELLKIEPLLEVMDLPFLFMDHAHVERILSGPIGKELLQRITTASGNNLHALAFSGEFRVLASAKKFTSSDEFKKMVIMDEGLRYRPGVDIARVSALRALGAKVLYSDQMGHVINFSNGKTNAFLAPYKEILFSFPYLKKSNAAPRFISDDRMTLFSTVIVIRESLFKELSTSQRKALSDGIEELAKAERIMYFREAFEAKEALAKEGVEVISLNEKERVKLKAMGKVVYKKFNKLRGGADLVDSIMRTGEMLE